MNLKISSSEDIKGYISGYKEFRDTFKFPKNHKENLNNSLKITTELEKRGILDKLIIIPKSIPDIIKFNIL